VVEAEGSGPYAEVDDVGRYHVRFMFDTSSAPSGKASRPMRMAQPHAGPNYGLHFPLRHGVEVVLTCINGDPDRPIITGAVPNPATPSTVISKNNTHNLIRTGGGSEIDIDDTTGSERIRLSTPFAESMFQLGAPGTQAPGSSLHTKLDASIDAGRDVTIKAGVKAAITAGNILTETSPFIDITGTEKLRMGSPVIEINGGASVDAGADKVKVVGRSSLTEEAPVIKITGSASVAIHAGASVFIHGASNVHVSSGAVAVEGGTVDISGSDVNIKGSTVSIKGGPIKLNT
jgi:phage baseplate assembly protein gpV